MISIIIPTYNRERILPRAINSVLKQSYQDFEILVIDDGSTDNTKQLIKKEFNNPKVKYYKLSHNQGVHKARNKGLDLAKGEYLIFLDSDDELLFDALDNALSVFSANRDIDILFALLRLDNNKLSGIKSKESRVVKYTEILCGNIFLNSKASFTMIRKKIIAQVRFVEQNLDFIFYRYLSRKAKIFFLNKILGLYHQSQNNSISYSRKKPNIMLSIKRSQALDSFLIKFKADYCKYCPFKYSNLAYGTAVGLILANKKIKAIKYAFEAFKYNKKRIKFLLFFIFSLLPFSSYALKMLFKLKRFFMIKNKIK